MTNSNAEFEFQGHTFSWDICDSIYSEKDIESNPKKISFIFER